LEARLRDLVAYKHLMREIARRSDTPTAIPPGAVAVMPPDRAMAENTGGIDLNAVDGALSVDGAGAGAGTALRFNIDPAMLEKLEAAPGITPVIINIQPLRDVRQFLGIRPEEPASAGA
jgi:hypothetical protein